MIGSGTFYPSLHKKNLYLSSLNKCHQIVNYGWNNCWYSNNTHDSWLMFDFKEKRLLLRDYSVKSPCKDGYLQFLHWRIQGSNDNATWTDLDARDTEYQRSSDMYYTRHFQCRQTHAAYRFIKIRHTGTSRPSDGFLSMILSEIEFFGTLFM